MLSRFELLGTVSHTRERLHTAAGTPFSFLRVATQREVNGQQRTDYHFMTVWAPQAQRVVETLEVGDRVFVEGRIDSTVATHHDALRANTIRLVATRVVFIHRERESNPTPEPAAAEPIGNFFETPSAAEESNGAGVEEAA